MAPPRITSRDLIELLAIKHRDDVFVPECKDGPTQYAEHLRLDAWAMKKSWSKPAMIGYETKVSRSDWLRDDKLIRYLPLCNLLYVVAPSKIVQVDELPEGVGLMVPTTNATGLLTKRKAAYREVEDPNSLFRYILMCRAKIGKELNSVDRATLLRDYVEGRRESREIGWQVSHNLRKETREAIEEAERKVEMAERRAESLAEAAQTLKSLGFENGIPAAWSIRDKISGKHTDLARLKAYVVDLERSAKGLKDLLEKSNGVP